MAGGGSTRFWPLGRADRPKHVLSILGKQTLLQATVARLTPTFSRRRILVVTGKAHAQEVRKQLPFLPSDHILVEPLQRNTAACLALAAEWLSTHVGDTVMAATPADHVIVHAASQRRALESALSLAAAEPCLVTIGVTPSRPETGYGYVELGARINAALPATHWVKRFHEKPKLTVARRYLRSGRHLWNSGIFVWRTSTFRDALLQCEPRVAAALDRVWTPLRGREGRIRAAYRRIPSVPVDLAVMQPLSTRPDAVARIAVVRGDFDWIDAGNWDAMAALWPRDEAGNATRGQVLALDSRNSVVYCPDRLVALVGVNDMVVVDAGDVTLVCARDKAQDVRRVVSALQERGWRRYL
jgi:mannose-1-phosphate guanylyltransferase